jgi:hypothetical protein
MRPNEKIKDGTMPYMMSAAIFIGKIAALRRCRSRYGLRVRALLHVDIVAVGVAERRRQADVVVRAAGLAEREHRCGRCAVCAARELVAPGEQRPRIQVDMQANARANIRIVANVGLKHGFE